MNNVLGFLLIIFNLNKIDFFLVKIGNIIF